MQHMYKIGRIVNTFGIRGQVKVIADTDFPEERFKAGSSLYLLKDNQVIETLTVAAAQLHKGTYLVSFENYTNINQVEPFKNLWLAIDASQQQPLSEDEFYHHQIIGLNIVTTEGEVLGKVKEILSLGSNDVWVVKRIQPNTKDALIPYIDDVVKSVDLANATATIELMEGLIDDEN
ncbi:ribosome maturation factor RimM [Aerococcaceae bacterium zg-1292]|uniref:ribosome maturation factor RimM n=1 Tax=Aerococcaceae bacterium zg-1292 TaxID=2774330 RepID=UPI003858FA7D